MDFLGERVSVKSTHEFSYVLAAGKGVGGFVRARLCSVWCTDDWGYRTR